LVVFTSTYATTIKVVSLIAMPWRDVLSTSVYGRNFDDKLKNKNIPLSE